MTRRSSFFGFLPKAATIYVTGDRRFQADKFRWIGGKGLNAVRFAELLKGTFILFTYIFYAVVNS